jgi:elongation factor P
VHAARIELDDALGVGQPAVADAGLERVEFAQGDTFDQRVSATDFLDEARLETKELQVMYQDGDMVHVMDGKSYEQYSLSNDTVGELKEWLQPEVVVQADWLDGRPIGLRLPKTMELEIVDTAPIMKTATKTASSKPATLSNGVVIQVPEFLSTGERVRVDPNTGEYMDRAK